MSTCSAPHASSRPAAAEPSCLRPAGSARAIGQATAAAMSGAVWQWRLKYQAVRSHSAAVNGDFTPIAVRPFRSGSIQSHRRCAATAIYT